MPRLTTATARLSRGRRVALAALPLVGIALAGCGSGRHNQQYLERSVVNGASASVQGLSIRDAYITTPAAKGGAAVVAFSLYADTPGAATQLVSVNSDSLSSGNPAQLSTVDAGIAKVASSVPVAYQAGPGASIASARFDDISAAVRPATYVDMTFTFANQLTIKLPYVPVAQVGQVDPLSTSVPTSFPEEPFPLRTSLPGEGVASSGP